MPLLTSIHDDRRYSLLLRSRQPSVSEIVTNNSAKKSLQKKNNKQKEEDDNATCCTASTASSSLSTSTSSTSSSVSSLRSTRKKKNNKKTVAFAPYVDIHETIALADMTEQEQLECWYTKKQLKEIKVVLTQTVRMMVSGRLDHDTDEYCARGLDIRTTAGCAKRRQNKRMGWDAVLNEQAKQHEKAMQRRQQQQHDDDDDNDDSIVESRLVLDDEAIATAFIQANLHCRKAAIMNGLRDELESLRINNLTRNIKSMMNNNNNSNNSYKKDDAATTKATLALNVLRKRNETATKKAPSSSSSFPTKTLRKYFLGRTMRKGTRDILLQEIHNQRTATTTTTTTTRKQQQQQQ